MADVFGDVVRGTRSSCAAAMPADHTRWILRQGMDLDCSVGLQTEEVFAEWLQLQNRFRTYDPQQRSLRYRRILVDWMSELGEYFRLNVSTTHVAVRLLRVVARPYPLRSRA